MHKKTPKFSVKGQRIKLVIPVSSMLYGTELSMSAIILPGRKSNGERRKDFSFVFLLQKPNKREKPKYCITLLYIWTSNAHNDFTMCFENIQEWLWKYGKVIFNTT